MRSGLILGVLFLAPTCSSGLAHAAGASTISSSVADVRPDSHPQREESATARQAETVIFALRSAGGGEELRWIGYGGVAGRVLLGPYECHLSPEEAEDTIAHTSRQVILALKNRDMEEFARYVHPQKGVRFSPYTYVEVDEDLRFTSEEIPALLTDKGKRSWGYYDGSGDPIHLTFEEFYAEFVYDHDYAHAPEIAYNAVIGKGNTKNNSSEVYPCAIIVEYHFPGFVPEQEGMDWSSLRLAFQEIGERWYVVGIIHDEWTI